LFTTAITVEAEKIKATKVIAKPVIDIRNPDIVLSIIAAGYFIRLQLRELGLWSKAYACNLGR
jgi:hypothetical protein